LSTIGNALFFSRDVGSAAATGWKGTAEAAHGKANGVAEGYAGSLFQQLIIRMLTEKGQAADAANSAAGEGAPDMATGPDSGLLAEALLTEDDSSIFSLLYEAAGAGETAEGSSLQTGSPESGGQTDEIQALMTAMAGLMPVLDKSQTSVGSQSAPGDEVLSVSGISAAAVNDAGIPASLKALFMNGGKAAVTAEAGDMQAAEADGGLPTTGSYDSGGKGSITTGTGQTALNSGNSAVQVSTEIASAATANTSRTEQNAFNAAAMSGQADRITEAFSGMQAADAENKSSETAAWKTDKAFGEAAADTGRIPQEAPNLYNAVQTGTAEQNPDIPSVNKAEPYSQIRDEILTKLEQKGPSEFKMQLEPAELGQIDIKLRLSEGKLIIDILAASAKTQALLISQVDKLIAGMGLQNVQVESVQVGQQTNYQGQDSSQGQGYQSNTEMDFSQRRQQERLQDEILRGGNLNSASGLQQDVRDGNPAGRIEAFRYSSNRMDYTV